MELQIIGHVAATSPTARAGVKRNAPHRPGLLPQRRSRALRLRRHGAEYSLEESPLSKGARRSRGGLGTLSGAQSLRSKLWGVIGGANKSAAAAADEDGRLRPRR